MEQRKEFLEAAMRGEHSFTELCRRFGISRKNGYKWLDRYRIEHAFPGGKMSFADRSRRPRNSPTAISAEVETAIVELRKQRPHWGPKKLRVVLGKQNPELVLPSETTFAAVLKRNGLVRPRKQRTKSTPYTAPLGHAQEPNAVWAIDFEGDFSIGRTRCYPLTITTLVHQSRDARVRHSAITPRSKRSKSSPTAIQPYRAARQAHHFQPARQVRGSSEGGALGARRCRCRASPAGPPTDEWPSHSRPCPETGLSSFLTTSSPSELRRPCAGIFGHAPACGCSIRVGSGLAPGPFC